MVDDGALREAMTSFVRTLAGDYGLGDALYDLTDRSLRVLGCDGAGISVGDPDGQLRFVTATEQRVVRLEEEQAIAQEGPCFEAFERGELVVTADLTAETRWERYRKTAHDVGFRSVAGLPLLIQGQRVGAMNLYREGAHDWSEHELAAARLLADMASGYIVNHRTRSASRALTDQLRTALDSRVVIEQAKGVLAAQHGISVSDAFDRLRRHARSNQRRLHDLARDVVDRRTTL